MVNIQYQHLLPVFPVFTRVAAFLMFLPGFSHRTVPFRVRLFTALSFSLALYLSMPGEIPAVSPTVPGLVSRILFEIGLGCLMGLICSFTYEAIQLGGHFIGLQLGFGSSTLFDPDSPANASLIAPLHGWLATLIFFLGDFHHEALVLIAQSFRITSELFFLNGFNATLLGHLIQISGKLFWVAIQLAAPISFLILACNLMLAVLSRLIPQMNVLFFGFPITIGTGLVALYVVAPELLGSFEGRFEEMAQEVSRVLWQRL